MSDEPILPKEILEKYSTIDLINLVSIASEILAKRYDS